MRYLQNLIGAVALGMLLIGQVQAASPTLAWAEAQRQTFADEQFFDGVVEAVHQATISAQTAGEIVELPYDVNDYVPKGGIVVRFVDTQQKARLDKAEAAEAEAVARLEEVTARHRRNQQLVEQKLVSKAQLEQSAADLKAAQAKLKLAQAATKEARDQWEYTVVRAPYAGVLVERFVEVGEHANVGTPLGTGLSLEQLRVKVAVPSRYAASIRDNLQSRVQAADGSWLQAVAVTLFPYADPASHTFTARVELPEGQHGLFPGMWAKTAFTLGEKTALVIPTESIVRRSELTGVYVRSADNKIQLRQLRIGRELDDGMTVVLAGLMEGELVALDPVLAGIQLKQQEASHE